MLFQTKRRIPIAGGRRKSVAALMKLCKKGSDVGTTWDVHDVGSNMIKHFDSWRVFGNSYLLSACLQREAMSLLSPFSRSSLLQLLAVGRNQRGHFKLHYGVLFTQACRLWIIAKSQQPYGDCWFFPVARQACNRAHFLQQCSHTNLFFQQNVERKLLLTAKQMRFRWDWRAWEDILDQPRLKLRWKIQMNPGVPLVQTAGLLIYSSSSPRASTSSDGSPKAALSKQRCR